jgi:nucleoside-diphosphate-sugar epimerase
MLRRLNLESEKRQTILITGGAGYIGSVLVHKAVSKGFNVNILDKVEDENFHDNQTVKFFSGSITDHKTIEESLSGADFVIHLAGISDARAGKENPELTKKTNIDSLKCLLEISQKAGVKRFLFASTMGVYGNKYSIPLKEDLPLDPIDPYSESKAAGEEIIRSENSDCFTTTSLRLAMVYGYSPSMRYDFIVNRLTLDAIEKKQITIMGGEQKRPQVYIDDLSGIFLEFLLADKSLISDEAYNVVGVNPTIEEISTIIRQKLPDTEIKKLPLRNNEDSFEMDGSKLNTVIKYNQQKSLDKGIESIISEYSARRR